MKKHTFHGVDANVDIGILTIRDDEFRAVLDAFPQKAGAGVYKGVSRQYILRHAEVATGERYTVAILRQMEQGTGEAQHAARDLIDDLAPKLVLVVGIAGGLPSDDITLGDVVLGTRIHDYTIEAVKTGHEVTYAATGGPIDQAIAAAVATLAGREDDLGDWTSGLPSQPTVEWTEEGQVYGPPEWQRELMAKLEHHYGRGSSRRAPIYVSGPIASSDRLVKDPTVLFPWITTVRNLLAVEMESGGVYRAARDRCPMLAIRGISDIVGLKRDDAWTKFACASAAVFARAFLRTQPVALGTATTGGQTTTDSQPSTAGASSSPPKVDTGLLTTRPLTPANAARVASSILGGDILKSMSYVDPSTRAVRIATVRRTSVKDFDIRIHLLERIGATYQSLWSSEDLYGLSDSRLLDAEDIDGDGICEVIFSDHAHGTHQHSRYLHFYFPARKQVYSVYEDSDPSWLPRPPTPSTTLHPEPPKELRTAIENAAIARGFLKFVDDDLDRPEAAVRRWFRDNGHSPSCPISVYEYAGPPVWGSSIFDELAVGDVVWRTYFKGPVYRYDRGADRHYVVYAPADRYSWAKALTWDGESLWFGVHTEDGFIRFHETSTTLQRIPSIGGQALPNVEELSFDSEKGCLIINGKLRVRMRDLPPLPRF